MGPGDLRSGISNGELTSMMEYIVVHGVTVVTALRRLGLDGRISERTAMSLMRSAARQGSVLAVQALEAAAIAAESWIAWLLSLLGVVSWAAVAAAVVVGATAIMVGGAFYVYSGDRPIQAGNRPRPHGPNVAPFAAKPGRANDKYFVYAINTSGWSLYVGRPSDVEGRPAGSFLDGGTGNQPIEFKKLVEKEFSNSQDASAYLKTRITPARQSVWTGNWVNFNGTEYRTVHVGL